MSVKKPQISELHDMLNRAFCKRHTALLKDSECHVNFIGQPVLDGHEVGSFLNKTPFFTMYYLVSMKDDELSCKLTSVTDSMTGKNYVTPTSEIADLTKLNTKEKETLSLINSEFELYFGNWCQRFYKRFLEIQQEKQAG